MIRSLNWKPNFKSVYDGIQRRNNKNATDWLCQGGPQQKEQVEK